MTENEKIMPINLLKKVYVQKWMSSNTLARTIAPQKQPLMANKIFKMLISAFDNFN